MKFFGSLFLLFSVLTQVVLGEIMELTDKNFDEVVLKSGKYSFVKLYAEWCSHCKAMIPAFEALNDSYAKQDSIQILNINADKYKSIAQRFNIQSYPTLILFSPDESEDPFVYTASRDLETMQNFIKAKTDIDPAPGKTKRKSTASRSVKFHDSSFERLVINKSKSAFFAFTADWCGHCKNLKPVWNELANIFRLDNEKFLIGEVDTTGDEPTDWLKEEFQVKAFPTIAYIKDGDLDQVEIFDKARSLEELVKWVNEKTGSFRAVDGGFDPSVGIITEIAEEVEQLVNAPSHETRAEIVSDIIAKLRDYDRDTDRKMVNEITYYVRVMNTLIHGPEDFILTETTRLNKILQDTVESSAAELIAKKLNILKVFSPNHYRAKKEAAKKAAAEPAKEQAVLRDEL